MTEVLEPVAMVAPHKEPDDPKCPFCPQTDSEEHYKTYGGKQNKGGKLGDNINDPAGFGTSIETDARPKDGQRGKDNRLNQFFTETEPEDTRAGVEGGSLGWTFQAHHAIPGNQCLAGHDVEQFILGSKRKIKFDTGYSVNNPQNGVWLPSVPEAGEWPGVGKPTESFPLASQAMRDCKRQFHLSGHDIPVDVDGLDPETDEIYVVRVTNFLAELHGILEDWRVHCPNKTSDGKPLGNTLIHDALDSVSGHMINLLKFPPERWTSFVSRYARDFAIKARDPNVKISFEK